MNYKLKLKLKLHFLVKYKYDDAKMYKSKLDEWEIDEKSVYEYEKSTGFEYKKEKEKKIEAKCVKEQREKEKKNEENERKYRETLDKTTVDFLRNVRNRALLIDGDNHIECLKGLENIKDSFKVIKCWTVNNGIKKKLEKRFGIEVELVRQKPQAVDEIINKRTEKYHSKETFDVIYIVSHDKGFLKHERPCKVIVKESIDEIKNEILK